jgi:hypothetical protein
MAARERNTMTKNIGLGLVGLTALGGLANADDVTGVDRMLCAAGQVQICIENDTCYSAAAIELGIPDFVIIDTDEKSISTTPASGENRSTPFSAYLREAGLIYLQGIEGERAFSFVIDELTGRMTVAVARDGIAVNVFGACTDADL